MVNMDLRDKAIDLMQKMKFVEARAVLVSIIEHDQADWSLYYMAGQCCSMLQDYETTIKYLAKSVELNHEEPAAWLALGVAYQKNNHPGNAVKAFTKAIEIDRNYSFAYNSLAYTQFKFLNSPEKALQNYDSAIYAHSIQLVKKMHNDTSSPILKTLSIDGNLWVEYAMRAALYHCALDGFKELFTPTGKQAAVEEQHEYHRGLYWVDNIKDSARLYLPNYFNTFRNALVREEVYYLMIYNKGEVLQALGRKEEADLHFFESEKFVIPRAR
jgi:tetratricopeptide (TPR) repeat protein